MNYNWCYFPLETDGQEKGLNNQLPDFITQNGNPWAANNGWFNGNGSNTSLITPWSTASALFDGVALPKNGSYLIGLQVELGAIPANDETLLFCGYNGINNGGGLRIDYNTSGEIDFIMRDGAYSTFGRKTDNISNSIKNIFCHIDHRPAGIGVDTAYVHTYQNNTDVKKSSHRKSLSLLDDIYPGVFDDNTALIIGASQENSVPVNGTHFSGKIRRLHIMKFGDAEGDEPSNVAEIMNELSKADMVPTASVLQIAGISNIINTYSPVQYT